MVFARSLPPVGPCWFPMDSNRRHGIEPAFGQLASDPASMCPVAVAHTLLVSKELCHVALPLRDTGSVAFALGYASMLAKWVMICTGCPNTSVKRVASGRALLTVQDVPPLLVGRQT